MKPIIYLDMDGVCTDFYRAAIVANNRDPNQIFSMWEQKFLGEYHPYNVMELDIYEYWDVIDSIGEQFWGNLDEYEWYKYLYRELHNMAEVVFLSSGAYAPWSLSGKLKWLQQRFDKDFQNYIFTSQKHHLAKPGSILIDDFDDNISLFQQKGGQAVLFPQIWNKNHQIKHRLTFTLESVKKCLCNI